jgi:DNA recombination protein RmuC
VVEALLVLVILLLLGALALLAALWKQRREGGTEVQQQLRAEAAGLAAKAEELRGQVEKLDGRSRELEQQLSDAIGGRRAAEATQEAERKNLTEQKALLDRAEVKLREAFKSLSADALTASRNEFLTQADQKLRPIQDLMAAYELHLREIEKVRSDAYGGLKSHLETLAKAHDVLQKEAHQLSTALRSPTSSGEWGQLALRNVVELAGMSRFCDFEEQVSVSTEDGRQRPDLTVRLPNHRMIVVDAKAPLNAYREACAAADESARREALVRHAQAVRNHVKALGQKSYWSQFEQAPDFVVLFLPGESFFSGAVEQDHTLIEDGMKSGVVLASPTTLIALLRAVAYGWRQEEVAENAQKIAEAGQELYDRLWKFVEHFERVGEGLARTVKAYDATLSSYQARVQPAGRRLAEQASVSGKELPEIPRIEEPSRSVERPALGGLGEESDHGQKATG